MKEFGVFYWDDFHNIITPIKRFDELTAAQEYVEERYIIRPLGIRNYLIRNYSLLDLMMAIYILESDFGQGSIVCIFNKRNELVWKIFKEEGPREQEQREERFRTREREQERRLFQFRPATDGQQIRERKSIAVSIAVNWKRDGF